MLVLWLDLLTLTGSLASLSSMSLSSVPWPVCGDMVVRSEVNNKMVRGNIKDMNGKTMVSGCLTENIPS